MYWIFLASNLLCTRGLLSSDPPASVFQTLVLQACTVLPGFIQCSRAQGLKGFLSLWSPSASASLPFLLPSLFPRPLRHTSGYLSVSEGRWCTVRVEHG